MSDETKSSTNNNYLKVEVVGQKSPDLVFFDDRDSASVASAIVAAQVLSLGALSRVVAYRLVKRLEEAGIGRQVGKGPTKVFDVVLGKGVSGAGE